MDTGDSGRVEALFEEALALDEEERRVLVARVARLEPALAEELASLLAARGEDPDFLERAPAPIAPELTRLFAQLAELGSDAPRGSEARALVEPLLARLRERRVGAERYERRGEIGRGGMGVVLRVFDQDLEREIALKHLRADEGEPAPADPRALALFLKEARVTGGLDHPGIVPVHELGVDERGAPYFTMRLVRGRELGIVLAQARRGEGGWSVARALGVLVQVCDALAYAHSRGVVHRDLKPSNVLVGPFGEVVVMDWGVARVMAAPDADGELRSGLEPETPRRGSSELFTADGSVVGTPAFMAPEQARGERARVGPATDVYALGAILYELLAGHAPYVAHGASPRAREVLERALAGPPPPLGAEAGPPELVAIVERAMARAPEERYADMSALAADLRAFLEGRVVAAYERGAWAELKKWVRRNRPLSASLAAALAILVAGLASTTLVEARGRERSDLAAGEARAAQVQARADAEEARRQRAGADRVVDFMVELFRSPDPELALGRPVTARELLERGTRALELERDQDPLTRARLLHAIGRAHLALGDFAEADAALTEALALRAGAAGGAHPDAIESRAELGVLACERGELARADELLTAALADAEATLEPEHEKTQSLRLNLALLRYEQGRYEESEVMNLALLATRLGTPGTDELDISNVRNNLGLVYQATGRLVEAREQFELALAIRRAAEGDDHPRTMNSLENLAGAIEALGNYAEAEPMHREAWERRERVLGPEHPRTLSSMNNTAVNLILQRRFEEALELAERSSAEHERVLGPEHADTLGSWNTLAGCLQYLGRFDESVALREHSCAAAIEALGPDHPGTAQHRLGLADVLESAGRKQEAEARYRELVPWCREKLGPAHPLTLTALNNFGILLVGEGRGEEAAPLLRESLDGQRARDPDHPDSITTQHTLVDVHIQAEHWDEALPLARDLLARTPEGDRFRGSRESMVQLIEAKLAARDAGGGR